MNKKLISLFRLSALAVLFSATAFAQLPTPTYGFNLGNTMEPTCGIGCWGNPLPNQALINAIKAAGFNTVRVPCAWMTHANSRTYAIDPTYMAQVQQVVDLCIAANLTVIINEHWDGGWFENSAFRRYDSRLNTQLQTLWNQIATRFKSYDSRLIFACANEPGIDSNYGPTRTAILLKYYQNWVNTIRGTGGNNATRWLAIQGPNTNIGNTYDWFGPLPTDSTPGRLIVEVHDYDPYNYTMMTSDQSWGNMFYFWGQGYHSAVLPTRNPTWGEEDWIASTYAQMQTKYTSQGIPVLLGEFGAMDRTGTDPALTGNELTRHLASRTYFDRVFVQYGIQYGLKPCYWDTGSLFDRNTGAVKDQGSITALTGGAATPPPPQ